MVQIKNSPPGVRAFPFLVFVLLTAVQGKLGASSAYWVYVLKTFLGLGLFFWMRSAIKEMRWTLNGASLLTGVAIFGLWVGLDGHYPTLSQLTARWFPSSPQPTWNPFAQFGDGSLIAWFVVVVRILGTAYVVPPIEEALYRSLMYRSIARPDFENQPLSRFSAKAFILTSVIFGLMHPDQWLAGILCGLAYQALVLRCGHLGEAMAAHGVTNCLLGCWVVWKGAWHFW